MENVRRRQCSLRNDESFSVKAADEIADPVAVYIGLNVTNVPGKPEFCIRDLDGEEVKTRVRREALDENLQVFEFAERNIDDCRRRTKFACGAL
jgi:hypothetical protein